MFTEVFFFLLKNLKGWGRGGNRETGESSDRKKKAEEQEVTKTSTVASREKNKKDSLPHLCQLWATW